jgi:hypothetical protein
VSAILTRIRSEGVALEPLEPPNRHQDRDPGELLHVDVKKLGHIPLPAPSSPVAARPTDQR